MQPLKYILLFKLCIPRLPIQPESAVRSTVRPSNASEPGKEKHFKKAKFTAHADGRLPLIIFGNGIFGKDGMKIKGYRHGLVKVFYQMLKRREARGELVVVTIDEYLTSQVNVMQLLLHTLFLTNALLLMIRSAIIAKEEA